MVISSDRDLSLLSPVRIVVDLSEKASDPNKYEPFSLQVLAFFFSSKIFARLNQKPGAPGFTKSIKPPPQLVWCLNSSGSGQDRAPGTDPGSGGAQCSSCLSCRYRSSSYRGYDYRRDNNRRFSSFRNGGYRNDNWVGTKSSPSFHAPMCQIGFPTADADINRHQILTMGPREKTDVLNNRTDGRGGPLMWREEVVADPSQPAVIATLHPN